MANAGLSSLTLQNYVPKIETGAYLDGFYPRNNPSGYLTSSSSITGAIGQGSVVITNNSGGILYISGSASSGSSVSVSGYATSGDLYNTGSILNNRINNLSGFATGFSGLLQSEVNILNNQTGLFYLRTNPSGYLTQFATNGTLITEWDSTNLLYTVAGAPKSISWGVGQTFDSGDNISIDYNNRILYGQWNITGINTGQFYLKSNPQNYSTSGNVQSTGQNLYNLLTNASGQFNINNKGQTPWTGNINATGYQLLNLSAISFTGAGLLTTNFGGITIFSTDINGNISFPNSVVPDTLNVMNDSRISGWLYMPDMKVFGAHNKVRMADYGTDIFYIYDNTELPFLSNDNGESSLGGFSSTTLSLNGTSSFGFNIFEAHNQGVVNIYSYAQSGAGQVLRENFDSISTNLYDQTGAKLLTLKSGNIYFPNATIYNNGSGNYTNLSVNNNQVLTINNSGAFYSSSNPQNYASSGNIQSTGQNLYNYIIGNSGYIENLFVHRTGQELITGIKEFASEIRFNSGIKTPLQFIGDSNFTWGSGHFISIITGAISNITGILPSATDYSGKMFIVKNNKNTTFQLSGTIDGIVNPTINSNDGIILYGYSGNWTYLNSTGNQYLDTRTTSLSGQINTSLTSSGVSLISIIQNTGQQAWTATNNNSINLSGNLALSGTNLYNLIVNESGQLSTNLTQTGVTIENQITSLSGWAASNLNLQTTGSNLYSLITNLSGQSNINYAPALNNYVYQTGIQNITGIKTFASEIRINSGIKIPSKFVNANYTLTSGDNIVIATGSLTNITGILPSSIDYSGVLFNIINGGTTSYQISGTIGQDVNPILYQYESIGIYAYSGAWQYLNNRSGSFATTTNLTLTGQTLYNNIIAASGAAQNNGINISGNLAITGQTLRNTIFGGDTNLSGNLATTGTTLYNLTVGLSGALNSSGAYIETQINSLSGFATGFSGVLQTSINNIVVPSAVTGLQITGGNSINGLVYISGLGGYFPVLLGNTIQFSGMGGSSSIDVYGNRFYV